MPKVKHHKTDYKLLIVLTTILVLSMAGCSLSSPSLYPNAEYLGEVGQLDITHLAWSPKGDLIAVTAYSSTKNLSRIFILSIGDKSLRPLLETTYCELVVGGWSPNGEELVFSAAPGCKDFVPGIWTMNVSGEVKPKFLTDGDLASWSPVGGKLAILRTAADYQHRTVHLFDLATKEDRLVYETAGKYISRLAWSPDGRQLVFEMGLNDNYNNVDIYTLGLDDRKLIQLTDSNRNLTPDWSPHGDVIIYVSKRVKSDSRLYISKSDGNCRVEVPRISDVRYPTWSPSGRQIAYIDKLGGVYLLNLAEIFGEDFPQSTSFCR